MNIDEYLKNIKAIQQNILEFIDQNDNSIESNFQTLSIFLDDQNLKNNKHDLKLLLRFLVKVSNDYHRNPNFFHKIELILAHFKNEITTNYTKYEIFDIFKRNKRIILFLLEEKVIIIDEQIANEMRQYEFRDMRYPEFFYPELKKFECDFYEKNQDNENFEEKRKIGENDNIICEMIRNDSVEDFISYVNKTNFSLESKIKTSKYETNSFLIQSLSTSLIEYATFYGSIQIFQYLILNNVKLDQSLWKFAIHGKNAEIIHLLEENQLKPEKKFLNDYLEESIKCHHNDIANYFLNVYFQNDMDAAFLKSFKYYNFFFIDEGLLHKSSSFYDLCQYDYYDLVDFLLKSEDININEINEIKVFLQIKLMKLFIKIFIQFRHFLLNKI